MANCSWQCVLVCWGNKYDTSDIMQIVNAVRLHSAHNPPRFVLITDRDRLSGQGVEEVPIPSFFLQPEMLGSHAKLSMFELGVVPTDLPAVYLDLDTMVIGDLSELIQLLDHPRRIAMFQATLMPFGRIGCLLHKLTNGRWYTRGNSSIVVYHPAHCHGIAESFRKLYPMVGFSKKGTSSEEAFIAFQSQENLRKIPEGMAVKFPREVMLPWLWASRLKTSLPWVKKRREGLRAITFPGHIAKAERLVTLDDGQLVVDGHHRKTRWSVAYLGSLKQKIVNHYANCPAPSQKEVH